MNSIRLKITIELNQNHALNFRDLKAMRPIIERGIAGCLPETISVDTIRVTSIKETARCIEMAVVPPIAAADRAPEVGE